MWNMLMVIGNGEDTYLRFDKWLAISSLLEVSGLQFTPDKIWHVSDIIENGSWVLKDQSLLQVWNDIQQIQINANSYYWTWTASSSGICTSSSGWDAIRERGTVLHFSNVIWSPSLSLQK